METRTTTNDLPLLPELWLQILSFLSKRDLYACYFVSQEMSKLAHMDKLYSKAPGPWPKRNYALFKDKLDYTLDSYFQKIFSFENGDIIFLTTKSIPNQNYRHGYSLQHLDTKNNINSLSFLKSARNIIWIKDHQFAIVHDEGITKWDVSTFQLTKLSDTVNIEHIFRVNESILLIGLKTGACLRLDIENLQETTQISPSDLSSGIKGFIKQGNLIIAQYYFFFATFSNKGIFQSITPSENFQNSFFKAYIKQKVQPITNDPSRLPPLESKFESIAFFSIDFHAAPGYAFVNKINHSYLFNYLTSESLCLGKTNRIFKTGHLSNNDMYVVKDNRTLDCFEIHFGWNSEKNIFESSCYFPSLSGMVTAAADQLAIFNSLPTYHDEMEQYPVNIFNFKDKTLRKVLLDIRNPKNLHSKKLSEKYEFHPLNEDYLIGYRKSDRFESGTHPPIRIWDNKTGKPVYFNDVTKGRAESFSTKLLPDGNVAVTQHDKVSILRFGFFNKFDEPNQQAEKPATPHKPLR